MTTLERVEKVLREYKDESDLTIAADTKFEDLGLDSLDIVDVVMQIEEEFSIELEMENKIETVGQLIEKIESLAQ